MLDFSFQKTDFRWLITTRWYWWG